jgi:hypothetical protein
VQRRRLRHLAQVGPQPGLALRDRLQLPLLLAGLALRPGPLPAQLLRLPEALLDLVADHRALQEEADLLVGLLVSRMDEPTSRSSLIVSLAVWPAGTFGSKR